MFSTINEGGWKSFVSITAPPPPLSQSPQLSEMLAALCLPCYANFFQPETCSSEQLTLSSELNTMTEVKTIRAASQTVSASPVQFHKCPQLRQFVAGKCLFLLRFTKM